MANKDTVNKVKSLLEGHCYGPLREAAEKWLNAADEKYDIKDKADKAWDKLNDAADKYSDASAKFSEKMSGVSENLGEAYDKAIESEFIKQLKEGVSTVGDMLDTFGAKDAAEKFQAVAADKTDDLKGFATVAFKSLKAGLEEAKKTFDQEKK